MNKEYIYIDGKAIIKDDKGNQVPIEYYDNLDKVLVQENLVETMEKRIKELEKESEQYKKYNKKRYIPTIFPMAAIIAIIGAPIMAYFLGDTSVFTSQIDTVFGTMNKALFFSIFFSTVLLPLGAFLEAHMYYIYKRAIKEEKGINSELELLKKEIVVEKEKLINLQKEKTRDEENKEFRVVTVDDLKVLEDFKNLRQLYFDLGYNGEKYYKYYQNGILDNKLGEYYTEDGIEIAKQYLEEKGPTLTKK